MPSSLAAGSSKSNKDKQVLVPVVGLDEFFAGSGMKRPIRITGFDNDSGCGMIRNNNNNNQGGDGSNNSGESIYIIKRVSKNNNNTGGGVVNNEQQQQDGSYNNSDLSADNNNNGYPDQISIHTATRDGATTISTISFVQQNNNYPITSSNHNAFVNTNQQIQNQSIGQDDIILPPRRKYQLFCLGFLSLFLVAAIAFGVTYMITKDDNEDDNNDTNDETRISNNDNENGYTAEIPRASSPDDNEMENDTEEPSISIPVAQANVQTTPPPTPFPTIITNSPTITPLDTPATIAKGNTKPTVQPSPEENEDSVIQLVSMHAATWGMIPSKCDEDDDISDSNHWSTIISCGSVGTITMVSVVNATCDNVPLASGKYDFLDPTKISCVLTADTESASSWTAATVLFSCTGETDIARTATITLPETSRSSCASTLDETEMDEDGTRRNSRLRRQRSLLDDHTGSTFTSMGRFCNEQNDDQWFLWNELYECDQGERVLLTPQGDVWTGTIPNATDLIEPPRRRRLVTNSIFGFWPIANLQSFCYNFEHCDNDEEICTVSTVSIIDTDPRTSRCSSLQSDLPTEDELWAKVGDAFIPALFAENIDKI